MLKVKIFNAQTCSLFTVSSSLNSQFVANIGGMTDPFLSVPLYYTSQQPVMYMT